MKCSSLSKNGGKNIEPSADLVPKWRRIDIDATCLRRIDVDTTSFLHYVPAHWEVYPYSHYN